MISSMTGYGDSTVSTSRITAVIQINSVNNRFLDVRFNHGHMLAAWENDFLSILQKHLRRGKVEVFFNITFSAEASQFKIDEPLLASITEETTRLSKKYPVKKELSLTDMMTVRGLCIFNDRAVEKTDLEQLKKGFESAVEKMVLMRRAEGKNLQSALRDLAAEIRKENATIRKETDRLEAVYKKRLMERAAELKEELRFDENRLHLEVASLLNRSDITEELQRIDSHLEQLAGFLKEEGGVGKKLDFLVQELLRETNTVASKVQDEKVSRSVIRIKDCLEKIREQVQNIE